MLGNFEALAIEVWPNGYAVVTASTEGDVFSSEDEGASWTEVARGLPGVSKAGHYRNIPRGGQPAMSGAH
jgi:hypothetical protein